MTTSRPTDYAADALLLQVAALRAELRQLKADLERAGTLPQPTPATDADLLRAIAGAVADRVFTASSLLRHAQAEGGELLAVLTGVCAKPTAKKVGKLLAKLEGNVEEHLAVQRVKQDNAGTIWSIRTVE